MENLFASKYMKEQSSQRLENLSPQKYGKAAYANLSYTPSKLADNILYKDLATQKKIEQESSKLRQTQALNGLFQDRLTQMQQQKDGIQKTLNQQISMYKKMLKDNQTKNQNRIRNLQDNFNKEMIKLLNEKQQQAKFSQSQKQILQNQIQQLTIMLNEVKHQLSNLDQNLLLARKENQRLKIVQENLNNQLDDIHHKLENQIQKNKRQVEQLKRQMHANELEAQAKFQKAIHDKHKQLQELERLHKKQLEKIQNKRSEQSLLKNKQLKDLAATFEKQMSRLNSVIDKKDELINQLNKTIQIQKQRNFNGSKGYQTEINNLAHEKARLKQELMKADRNVQRLSAQVKQLQVRLSSESLSNQTLISQLKKDLQLNQLNFIRQVDKNQYAMVDLEKEIVHLRVQNDQAAGLAGENSALHRQLRNMKELLMESSLEMERCKEQFIRLGREKDLLTIKLRQMGIQNQTLYRIKNQREDQARGWRESYMIQKGSHY